MSDEDGTKANGSKVVPLLPPEKRPEGWGIALDVFRRPGRRRSAKAMAITGRSKHVVVVGTVDWRDKDLPPIVSALPGECRTDVPAPSVPAVWLVTGPNGDRYLVPELAGGGPNLTTTDGGNLAAGDDPRLRGVVGGEGLIALRVFDEESDDDEDGHVWEIVPG
jgi:hypothetical protein